MSSAVISDTVPVMSEVIPEDEDRDGSGAIGGRPDEGSETDQEGGTGADDGGPGSQNM